ncbi:TolC family protein [uncultured Desulfobacter sp.]|uniref:TolC family protein n=1 Tax=uncultured Desulfobacter sp. TaxID=240139 RepID=UPI0029C6411A|nr:TolC family protein [uncultured Desulfobacter sp.]
MKRFDVYIGLGLILTLFLGAPAGLTWAGEQKMTLEQCLKTGIENNPSLKASRFDVDMSAQGIKQARADFLPSVSSSYSMTPIRSINSKYGSGTIQDTDYIDKDVRSFSIRLTQILYAGSRITNTYQRARVSEQLAKTEMELAGMELAYRIETTFYKLMKAKQDVITTQESVNRLTESVKSAEAFLERELVPWVNVLQARVDLADAQDLYKIAKNDVNRQRVELFSLMNQRLDPAIEFSGPLNPLLATEPVFDDSLKYALENRPDIKSLGHQLEIAQKDAQIAMGKYLPTVKFDVGYYDRNDEYDEYNQYGKSRDQRNRYWSGGLTASWDLFDGGRAWYEKEKYNTQAQKITALIEDAKNEIATGIYNALYSMNEAKQRIKTSAEALTAANEYYDVEKNRLKAGLSTIPSLLDAQDRLLRAHANETRATLDYQLAVSELKFYTGKKNIE